MRSNSLKATLKTAALAVTILLLTAGVSFAQTVNMRAQATTTTLSDGQTVPMWGFSCLDAGTLGATCTALSTKLNVGWAPPLITVSTNATLTINLTNSLPGSVPTSLMIVGQLGGGLGDGGVPTRTPSPNHAILGATWPIAGDTNGATFKPPTQADRVQSFGAEVAHGAPTPLTWKGLKAGTYLIESGTHPSIQGPMGLYGVLVVTTPAIGATPAQAYPGVSYDADAVMLFSEIDALQNRAVDAAVNTVGFSESAIRVLRDSVSSVSLLLDAAGMVINAGTGYHLNDPIAFTGGGFSLPAAAHVSSVDVNGAIVAILVDNSGKGYSSVPTVTVTRTSGTGVDAKIVAGLSLAGVVCSNGTSACYPPAVNYDPRYYLVNGQSFDKTAPGNSTIQLSQSAANGNVFVRLVNAGLRMHVPSLVGLNMSLIAEDGNVQPEIPLARAALQTPQPKVQSEVFLAAGKVFDVVVKPLQTTLGTYDAAAFPVFDRQLSLSTNNKHEGGMLAYVQFGNAAAGSKGGVPVAPVTPTAVNDNYKLPPNKTTFSANVLSNDIGIISATVGTGPAHGTVLLNPDGTFTYTPTPATPPAVANIVSDTFTYCGNGACSNATPANLIATVAISVVNNSNAPPVAVPDNYTTNVSTLIKVARPGVLGNDSDFNNYPLHAVIDASKPITCGAVTLNADGSFTAAAPSAGMPCQFNYRAVNSQGTSSDSVAVSLTYQSGNGPMVSVVDAQTKVAITDYRWTIEEDTTFRTTPGIGNPNSLSTNFHKSHMPLVATGCVGPLSCGQGQMWVNPKTGTDGPLPQGMEAYEPQAPTTVDQIHLDPAKYYFISILPGDAANPFNNAYSGSPANCLLPATDPNAVPLSTCGHTMGGASIAPAQTSVTVLVEPNPLPPAQLTVYVFEDNNPTNGVNDFAEKGLGGFQLLLFDKAGKIGDPTGQMTYDAFNQPLDNALNGTIDPVTHLNECPISGTSTAAKPTSIPVGMILTCPEFESDGKTPSPLVGQALIKNLMPGRFEVVANPGADREARGEVWLITSTIEGTRGQETFLKAGEPPFWQTFGLPSFHAWIGFVNPDHVAKARAALPAGGQTITGRITNQRIGRVPNSVLLDSNSRAAMSQTTCYVGLNSGNGNGANIAFAKCADDGSFAFSNVPRGTHQLVVWDQWLDQIISYVTVTVATTPVNMGNIPVFSWFTSMESSTFLDIDGTHQPSAANPGIGEVPTTVRYRDGSYANTLLSDFSGHASFRELFPLFNWYVVESDTTRYKGTGVNITVDAGGPVDTTGPYAGVLNSHYFNGDSTTRTDAATTRSEGVQGTQGQTEILNWGKIPYQRGENGGITGVVVYASTRPFDDPMLLFQNLWAPLVPNVPVNLYQETAAPDGTTGLKLIDQTSTSSWDDFVNSTGAYAGKLPMNCPGQIPGGSLPTGDPFVSLTLGSANQSKCYDGFHSWNQVQPAVYNGRYQFPSANCTGCVANPNDPTAPTILPVGKYVAEVVPPAGYEIVKEEDKNILIGDAWIAQLTPQFATLGNIFILPDQATVNAYSNPNSPYNPTTNLGRTSLGGFGPGGIIAQPAPCVGNIRRVPDFLSLFPQATEVAPFAGADRPLCDRKEITLEDQMQAQATFFIYTPAHVAGHITGVLTDDLSVEFNPAAPDYGEKYTLQFAPISFRDLNGVEVGRTYTDQWGRFNGLMYSTWQVNVPNPTGYSPNMMHICENDPGPIPDPNNPGQMIIDPQYNPLYSNMCSANAFMPGLTDYMDVPVFPLAAFAPGYNPPDCAYPDTTPAVKRVDSSAGFGPYLTTAGGTLTIASMGNTAVPNPAYAGPTETAPKTITRNYGFGVTPGKVTLAGVQLAAVWTDSTITAAVPPGMQTGQLVVTAANGRSSVDAATVTIEDRTPTRVRASAGQTIQAAIDAAAPGDLILVDAGAYSELLIMWKPVRLQGVGAGSVTLNAAKYPLQKLEPWRKDIDCLFGLNTTNCRPGLTPNAVDPLPNQFVPSLEVFTPTSLPTEQGAAITVLGKNLTACTARDAANPGYICNVSSIGGFSITGGDAGGGVYVNGWAHNLEIANNRVFGNAGLFTGGIRVGQPYLGMGVMGDVPPAAPPAPPGSSGYNYDQYVYIHHNSITSNGTVEGNLGAPGSGGGVSICSGTDNYRVSYNFICGNFSQGDGGGLGHVGVSKNGLISYNSILFNQNFNQNSTVSGGGLAIEGEPALVGGLSLGSGSVRVDSNLILGNQAEAGHGGGVLLQEVNGADVALQPGAPDSWYQVTLTNNMITNNFAGWSGAGISLRDTVNSKIINNTVVSNDSVATVGPVFNQPGGGPAKTVPQPAGISSELHSPLLAAAFGAAPPANVRPLAVFSNPVLSSNIIWQNRAFSFDATSGTPTLLPPLAAPTAMRQCTAGASYWDLGIVGDTSATPGSNRLNPVNSVLTSAADYDGTNTTADPNLVKQYCNGSRGLPPDTMAAAVTLPEGGNFVQVRYGPLSLTDLANPSNVLGNYHITASSPAVNAVPCAAVSAIAPNHDFDGNPRPVPACPTADSIVEVYDIGAHEVQAPPLLADVLVSPSIVSFPDQPVGTSSPTPGTRVTLSNVGTAPLTIQSLAYSGAIGDFLIFPATPTSCNTVPVVLAAGQQCAVTVRFRPTAPGPRIASVTMTTNDPAQPTVTVSLSGRGISLTFSTKSLTFGPQQFGTISAAQQITVSNNGVAPRRINAIGIGPNPLNFKQTNTCVARTLQVGQSCTINVTFTPNGVTTSPVATLIETDSLAGETVALSGTAVAPSDALTPASLLFVPQQFGTVSPPQPVTLSNNGIAPLTINITIVGTNPMNFKQTNTCGNLPVGLPAGGSCTINVAFTPNGVTTSPVATLSVVAHSGTYTLPAQTVALSGAGQPQTPSISPTSLAFTPQKVGTSSASLPVTLTNAGIGPLSFTSITFGGTNPLEFNQTNNCTPSMAIGASCTINVRFAPGVAPTASKSTGPKSATMVVHDGAGTQSVLLSGTAN